MRHSKSCIVTQRLWLREIDESDAETIVRLRSNPKYYRYFLNPRKLSVDEHLKWYKMNYVNNPDRLDWLAIDDENGSIVGLFGMKKVESNVAEVSYLLSDNQRRKGYASEAVIEMIKWVCRNWGITTFIANIHYENFVSITFIEKLQFKKAERNGNFIIYRRNLGINRGR